MDAEIVYAVNFASVGFVDDRKRTTAEDQHSKGRPKIYQRRSNAPVYPYDALQLAHDVDRQSGTSYAFLFEKSFLSPSSDLESAAVSFKSSYIAHSARVADPHTPVSFARCQFSRARTTSESLEARFHHARSITC